MTRAGIMRLLSEAEPAIHVVGEAASGRQAIAAWREHRPDVVLMDLQMPDGDGTEAIARIRSEDPDASIVALPRSRATPDRGRLSRGGTRFVGRTPPGPSSSARFAASRGAVLPRHGADRLDAI
jgi:DNA-binding NarL/FixJ family response regulator